MNQTHTEFKTALLDRFKIQMSKCVCPPLQGDVEIEVLADLVANHWIAKLNYSVVGEVLDTIRYPADWWQALKKRFAPRWFLARWPVVHTVVEARAYYPKLALPYEKHILSFEVVTVREERTP